jgi:DNA invertase Pin-like site-specific DNA recombinase
VEVIGYIRVSHQEQQRSGAGLEAQRRAILTECKKRGWQLVETIEDGGYSGKDLRRPGIKRALDAVESGRADALVVAKWDRLSRSMLDFVGIMDRAQRKGWGLVALDADVDTTTPTGRAVAHVTMTFAQLEREKIGERIREALAVKRSQGVRLGRPPAVPANVQRRIGRERKAGKSYAKIADSLNGNAVPTAHGGARWYASTVREVVRRGDA